MTVGDEVRSSLDHWSAEEWRQALWHATAALQETAAKRYPSLDPGTAFRRTIRDEVDIFGAMAGADIDFGRTRYPVPVATDSADGRPDIADVLYGVHRYLHGEEDAMPAGCEVVPHVEGEPMFAIGSGRLWLRASAALGLLAVAVFAKENKGEQIPWNYQLGWQQHIFHVVGWWGWAEHFREIVADTGITRYELDFGPEWEVWAPRA
jgi:hypothetical protein